VCIDNLWKFLWKTIWPKYRPGNKEYIKMGFIFFWASNNLLWFFKSYNAFFCWRIIRSAKNPRNIRPNLLHAPSRSHRSATYYHWNVDPGLTSQWEQGNSGGAELRQRSGEPRPRTHWGVWNFDSEVAIQQYVCRFFFDTRGSRMTWTHTNELTLWIIWSSSTYYRTSHA